MGEGFDPESPRLSETGGGEKVFCAASSFIVGSAFIFLERAGFCRLCVDDCQCGPYRSLALKYCCENVGIFFCKIFGSIPLSTPTRC